VIYAFYSIHSFLSLLLVGFLLQFGINLQSGLLPVEGHHPHHYCMEERMKILEQQVTEFCKSKVVSWRQ